MHKMSKISRKTQTAIKPYKQLKINNYTRFPHVLQPVVFLMLLVALKMGHTLRQRLHEIRVDSSRGGIIPATIKITAPAYKMGETRRVEISSRDEISTRIFIPGRNTYC